jgi:hypothetical protein
MMEKAYKDNSSSSLAIGLILLAILPVAACSRKPKETAMPPPPTVSAPLIDPWREAANLVEEDRNEPTGRKAQVEVPDQLKHYRDRRRFLAVQIAESHKQAFDVPHDYIELIELIRSGKFVEVEPVGNDYILYGVGENATDEPFYHFDRATGENIPLYPDLKGFQQEYEQMKGSAKQVSDSIAALGKELRNTKRRDRQRRREIQSQISEARSSLRAIGKRMSLLASFYRDKEKLKLIKREYRLLEALARDFAGQTYDLGDPASRRKLKVRLLSFLRPESRSVLLEIARSYSKKFGRPLPVTSLVRPEQYQRLLAETNPNATLIPVPPHSTGMAFDVFYYYMTAAEQDFLMAEVSRIKQAGRVEALRENRNHIHIFAFAEGKPPDESKIVQSLSRMAGKPAPRRPKSAMRKRKGAAIGSAVARSTGTKSGSEGTTN